MSLMEKFGQLMERWGIIADCPPGYDDYNNYGPIIERVAELTGYHPALILGLMKQRKQHLDEDYQDVGPLRQMVEQRAGTLSYEQRNAIILQEEAARLTARRDYEDAMSVYGERPFELGPR